MTIRVFEHSGAALTRLQDNLLRQSTAAIVSELGALLKYQIIMLQVNQLWQRRHAYLFETAVVVMHDGDCGFIPMSMNGKLDHPQNIDFLIYLRDIAEMVPEKTPGEATEYIYGIGIKERGKNSMLALRFSNISAALDWTTAIRRLQYQSQLEDLGYNEAEEVAAFESFAAIMQVFRWQLEISQPLGRVLYHGLVTVGRSVLRTATGWIQLVLFDAALVLIRGTPPEIKYLLLASRIISISETEENLISLVYGTGNPDDDRLTEFRFRLQDANNDVATWVRMLHTFAPSASIHHEEHRDFLTLAQKHAREDSAKSTMEIGTGVVGLAMLHTTTTSDEFNISFAVNRSSESEGIASHLIAQILELAFDKLGAHRVQARVVHSSFDPAQTVRAIRLLIHLGFTHEGVRRRAALHPNEKQWADVSVLAMVELDWVIRARVPPAKGTLWDEMFIRQQREREVLLKLEGSRELKRTRSMETVRDLHSMNDALPSASMASSSVEGSSVTTDTVSLVSANTEILSWGGVSDDSDAPSSVGKSSSIGSTFSADDAADEYEEWDLEEDYSDNDEEEERY